MKPVSRAMLMTNQNSGASGLKGAPISLRPSAAIGTIPVISRFMERNSGMNVLARTETRAHKSDVGETRQRQERRNHATGQNANAVTGDAMHGRAEHLTPTRRDVLFMQPRQRLP